MQSITLDIPSGIGDVSWILSKLVHVKDREIRLRVADGWPHRTVKFLHLFPWITSAEYGNFNYQDIFEFQRMNMGKFDTWEQIKELSEFPMAPNHHLEKGRRLEDWLPDLPTDFHYEIPTTPRDKEMAVHFLRGLRRPIVGVSAASYRGSSAWKTWDHVGWMDFFRRVKSDLGEFTVLLMGGFWDDLTASLSYDLERAGFPCAEIVGKTNIGTAIEILRVLDRYIGFSSGLGILSVVMRQPTFMLWPEHQVELSTSWAPEAMIESREYVAAQWLQPDVIAKLYVKWVT